MGDALSPSGTSVDRTGYIDASRGLFVVWMIIAHSLTVAGIPAGHWMQNLRPAGWATVCFVMLTGFGLAAVNLNRPRLGDGFAKRKYRRALQLVVIAYLSNLASAAIVATTNGTVSTDYLLGVATFRADWSVSGSLIPVAALVALSPALLAIARRIHPIWLLPGVLALGAVAGSGVPVPDLSGRIVPLWTLTHWKGALGVPIVYLVAIALCAFGVGALAARLRTSVQVRILPVLAVAVPLSLGFAHTTGSPMELTYDLCIFVLSVGAVATLCIVPGKQYLPRALGMLGRAALLIFITHRVLLHLAATLLRPALGREALAGSVMVAAIVTCGGAAWAKHHYTRFRTALGWVGM